MESEAYKLFEQAENELRKSGYDPVNPMKLPHNHDKSWQAYMREDIKALCDCEAIFMLRTWAESKGARVEFSVAHSLGIKKIFQS